MKRVFMIAALMLLCLVTAGCPEKPEEEVINVVGEWHLSQITTKAAIGGQTVDIYVAFNEDHSFELYQMLGTGRYRMFTGTWSLLEKVLSGSYTGGAKWASDYNVEMNEGHTSLTLTTLDGSETSTYQKQAIPADVKENAL